jgi:SPP1 family predicted phage head-tail adaptor
MPYQQRRIPIGRRRERIAIQRASTSGDGMGGQSNVWTTIAEPWAQIWPLDERDKEALAAQQITAKHGYHIAIPYRADIRPTMRAIIRDTTMEIHTVSDDEMRRRRLVLQVGEVQ